MKMMKKLTSLLLVVLMIAVMATPVMAATVTVEDNSNLTNHTYKAYQVFSGREDDGILSNIEWGSGINDEAADFLTELHKITEFKDCTTAVDVAAVLGGVANHSDTAKAFAKFAYAFKTGSGTEITTATTELEDGYYLIVDETDVDEQYDANNAALLQITGKGNITIGDKNDKPSVTKKIKEDNDPKYAGTWNDAADYDIGDAVPFRLVGLVPDMSYYDTYEYKFVDTLTDALTYNKDVKVYTVTGEKTMLEVNSSTAVGAGGTELTTGFVVAETTNGFTVSFADLKTAVPAGTTYVVVEYTATLNENAVIGNDGNPNEVYLEFSNDPNQGGNGRTEPDEVVAFTFRLPIEKIDGTEKTALTGAKFAIFTKKADADAAAEAVAKNSGVADALAKALKFTIVDGVYKLDAAGTVVEIVDNGSGEYTVEGLDQGVYYLVETAAPAQYNSLTAALKVEILPTYVAEKYEDGHVVNATKDQLTKVEVKLDDGAAAEKITVENNKGATLPETGGMGTTIFYALGGLLAVGAVILLVTKRRMEAE